MRDELRAVEMAESRILIAANLTRDNVMDYLSLVNVDGVLLSGCGMSRTLDLLIPLALNVQGGDWKQP